jgi:hypothetical protein
MSDEKLRAKYMLLLDWRAQAVVLGGNVTSLCMICVYLQTSSYSKSPGYCIGHYVSAQPLTSSYVATTSSPVVRNSIIPSAIAETWRQCTLLRFSQLLQLLTVVLLLLLFVVTTTTALAVLDRRAALNHCAICVSSNS